MADNTNNKRRIVICGKGGGGQAESVEWDDILNKPEFATVATSGDYDDLTDKPTIPAAPVQSDWNEADSSSLAYIQNKPTIPAAQVNADWNSASGVSQILNKPNLATVATSGSYNDLTDKPTILTQWFGTQAEYDAIAVKDPNTIYNIEGSDNVQPDWNQNDTTADDYIKNKPTIPAAQVNADWNSASGVSQILNKPTLATVATSGDYGDLTNKPTIPAAQVNADWNSNSGVSQILNKPNLATVATTGNYSDLNGTPTIPAAQVNADWNSNSGVSQILNKPTIPTLPPMTTETLTFTLQGGTTKTVEFYVVPNYFYVQDISGSTNTLSISQPEIDAPEFDVFSSTDRVNWTNIGNTGVGGITATIPANGKLYLKATTSGWSTSGAWTFNKITASGNHNIGGNIMSLLNGDNFEGTTLNSSVTDNLQYLFSDDTALVSAEELILPTNVVDGCYSGMFSGCTSLTTAPALPATTLADYCYMSMFQGCTSLTTSPVLPAATLTEGCYMSMFYGCSSLDTITTYAEGEAPDALMTWVDGVAASGDFYNLGNYQYYDSGVNGIPTGWTEHNSL